jgi:ribosomal subunit interface protein
MAAALLLSGRRATLALGGHHPQPRQKNSGSYGRSSGSFGREAVVEKGSPAAQKIALDIDAAKLAEWRAIVDLPAGPEEVDGGADEAESMDSPKIKVTMAKKHFNYLGPALKEHVNTKLAQITERFGKHILSLDVHLEVLKNPRAKDEKYAAEVVAFVMPGNRKKTVPVRVKATSHDMFLAVNDMTNQIARKVRQLKEKVTKGMRHPGEGHAGSKGDASALLRKLPGSAGFDASDVEAAVQAASTLPPMTVQTALATFNLAEAGTGDGTDVFVFIDKDTQRTSLLYRDGSGGVNLYDPKQDAVTQIW